MIFGHFHFRIYSIQSAFLLELIFGLSVIDNTNIDKLLVLCNT